MKFEINDYRIDTESLRLQFYLVEETVNQYKKLIVEINNNIDDNKFKESFIQVMSKETFDLKQKYENLEGTIKILKTDVKINN